MIVLVGLIGIWTIRPLARPPRTFRPIFEDVPPDIRGRSARYSRTFRPIFADIRPKL